MGQVDENEIVVQEFTRKVGAHIAEVKARAVKEEDNRIFSLLSIIPGQFTLPQDAEKLMYILMNGISPEQKAVIR